MAVVKGWFFALGLLSLQEFVEPVGSVQGVCQQVSSTLSRKYVFSYIDFQGLSTSLDPENTAAEIPKG